MKYPENAKYSDIVRLAMKGKENSTGAPITIREASRRTGYSYEHIRKVVGGEPVVSQEFNEDLCKLLSLDAREMWNIALREKVQRRFKGVPAPLQPPADDFFTSNWSKLTPENIETLRQMAQGMILMNEQRTAGVRQVLAGAHK